MDFHRLTRLGHRLALAGLMGAGLGVAVSAPAHALFGFEAVRTLRATDIPADAAGFRDQAVRYYRQVSLFEADRMADWYDAEHFAEKGMAIANGGAPQPAVAAEQGITDPGRLARLDRARAALMAVLGSDGQDIAPKASAFALVSYDCWVEQAQEGHQASHIEACRTQFRDAMTLIAAAEAIDDPAVVAQAVVYFGFDSARLTPDGRAVLSDMATALDAPGDVSMRVVGHTDRSGSREYNQSLSERRATTVADALTAMGLTVSDIDTLALAGLGESAPAVATGDGVREPRNRRVVVQAVADGPGAVVVEVEDMPALESELW